MSLALSLIRRPYVELDFTRMVFDSRVSFSRSSTAARYKADKSLEFVASNAPRIDHDPATGTVRGLLVEEQRTNLLLRAQEFDNSAWAAAGSVGTVSANATTAPDGTATADKIVEAAGAGYHGRRQGISGLTELTTYRLSFFAKAAGRTRVSFWSFSGGDTGSYIFDLSTVTASRAGSTITAVGNGWYRCEGPVVTIAGQTARTIHIGPQDAGAAQSYTGDGTSGVYVWGAQLELASLASSYIPTTTAAVTRAADVASFTIPARVVRLVTIYYDGTTASQTVTPGATYTIPTGTKQILRIRGYYA